MNVLKFYIRQTNTDELNRIDAAQQRYEQHLRATGLTNRDDLLQYFGWDFFHDGEIKHLSIFSEDRVVSFDIVAPNIEPKDKDELKRRGYYWSEFKCKFKNVVWFSMEGKRIDANNDPLTDKVGLEYLYSEIDTLSSHIEYFKNNYRGSEAFYDEEPVFHSLIIELAPPTGFMGLVFTDLNVIPLEPLAWNQMLESDKYKIPLFRLK